MPHIYQSDIIIPQIHDNDGDENRKHTGMILIDLQNAFGTLDQKSLIEKMKCIC